MQSNQITELVRRVSHDHKLQRTEDTSLLRYPMDLNQFPYLRALLSQPRCRTPLAFYSETVLRLVVYWIGYRTRRPKQSKIIGAGHCN